ncbi:MAG: 4Fe-4S binding protein [Candidatus Gastranaerophilales bacterium]|nr:4Fe-4S binding protein [Candidatus Gastranaerophilales bacterium]
MISFKIDTLENNERMSTQSLLQLIETKIKEGYTSFEIKACGQHDIGGSSWAKDKGKTLNFKITNPGQRVGAMARKGTNIYVDGSVPADVGWLNSGANIVVNGDCGDTAGHCAASGRIYISGRVGTRSGALMKHDPKFETPQLWVLKNTGSFSFEFMGGGIAVICGYDCSGIKSVLGNRSCVGMVGGTIYCRGAIEGVAPCVSITELSDDDKKFLTKGMAEFLSAIDKKGLSDTLLDFTEWHKIIPISPDEKTKKITVKDFRSSEWIKGGIFGDFIEDDFKVYELAATGTGRLKQPVRDKRLCVDCSICINNCPQSAISKDEKGIYTTDDNSCIGCGICAAVCPKHAVTMQNNNKEIS